MDSRSMRPMKRVIILTGASPNTLGGMEHVIRELARGLTNVGFTVEIFHSNNSAPRWVSRPSSKWQAYVADAVVSWYLGCRVGAEISDDVVAVISNGPFGWYLPRLRPAIKKIHFYHGTYRGQATALTQFISRAGALKLKWWDSMILERLSGRRKQIICNSDQTRAEVLKFFGYSGSTLWLPLDTSHFKPMDKAFSRMRCGLSQVGDIGLFVGNASPMKGFSLVRRLIDALPDVKWVLALRGVIPSDLSQNNRVVVFKDAPPELLPSLYNAADFAICPSRYEPFGYVVAEALACGTPIVATPGGASRLFLSTPPFREFLIERADAFVDFLDIIVAVLRQPDFYRRSVIDLIRPEVERLMATANWLSQFRECTGI
jgi:glycosyltransferase involved in cell wall biosynthesis